MYVYITPHSYPCFSNKTYIHSSFQTIKLNTKQMKTFDWYFILTRWWSHHNYTFLWADIFPHTNASIHVSSFMYSSKMFIISLFCLFTYKRSSSWLAWYRLPESAVFIYLVMKTTTTAIFKSLVIGGATQTLPTALAECGSGCISLQYPSNLPMLWRSPTPYPCRI